MSGGGGDSKTTTEPWKRAQPYLKRALSQGESLYRQDGFAPDPYSGDRVAGFGDTTQQAQGMVMDRANAGAPLVDQASGTLSSMMDGNYQTDMLDRVKENALGSAVPAAVSQFSGSGMTNSTQAMDTVGRAATQAVAPYEYGAFENAQGRAMKAAGMAPGMEQAGYLPAQMIGSIGSAQDAMSQNMINADMSQYYEGENQARDNYQGYLGAMMGLGGMGGQTTQSGGGPSTGANVMSAGLGGLGAYGALAMNPVTAPFAVAGGLAAGLGGVL